MSTSTTSKAGPEEAVAAREGRASDAASREARARAAEAALQARFGALLAGIEAEDVRDLMREVFAHVSRLLGHVGRCRAALACADESGVVPLLLRRVRVESRHLLTVIETAELRVEHLGDDLREVFDSVAFAMGHELRRVDAVELAALDTQGRVAPATAVRACGLFENCFQQSAITLAQEFDPSVTGVSLFEDYKERREQSLLLRAELSSLLDKVKGWEAGAGMLANVSVLRHVRRFRYEHMHLLMYRDWEEFERFADSLEAHYESSDEFTTSLHAFSCYVETLRQQVSLRAVLAGC